MCVTLARLIIDPLIRFDSLIPCFVITVILFISCTLCSTKLSESKITKIMFFLPEPEDDVAQSEIQRREPQEVEISISPPHYSDANAVDSRLIESPEFQEPPPTYGEYIVQ